MFKKTQLSLSSNPTHHSEVGTPTPEQITPAPISTKDTEETVLDIARYHTQLPTQFQLYATAESYSFLVVELWKTTIKTMSALDGRQDNIYHFICSFNS